VFDHEKRHHINTNTMNQQIPNPEKDHSSNGCSSSPDDEETRLLLSSSGNQQQEIGVEKTRTPISQLQNTNVNHPDGSQHPPARALEHMADAYAAKKSWALARKAYSEALQFGIRNPPPSSNEYTNKRKKDAANDDDAATGNGSSTTHISNVDISSSPSRRHFSARAVFNILQKLSKACMNLKDYDSALKAQVKSLDVIDRSHTSANPRIAFVLNNMGHIHFKKGDMQNAIMFYQQYLDAQKSFPEDRRDLLVEAGTASTIGSIYRRIGRLNAAIDWHETAIKLRTEVLGEHHMSLSSDLIAIGHIHYCLRQLDFSLAAFSECVELFSLSICAPDTGLLASILFKMAGICIELDDRSAAINCYEDAVDAARAAVGSSSTSSTSKSTVTPSLASSCFKRTCCEVLIIRCLYNLARLHQEEGNISKAIDCAEEAVKFGLLDASTVLPRNESLTRILSFMIRLYHEKGDDAKIQLYCRRLSEVVDDCSRQPKRTKLFCARAA
jgi:tetratricopeptide (TPR) repeat protein